MVKQQAVMIESKIMWAATAYAFRINQGYLKYPEIDFDTGLVKKQPNREIINSIISDTSALTQQDYTQGQQIHTAMQGLIFQQIAGSPNPFLVEVLKLSDRDTWSSSDRQAIAILASVPLIYQRQQRSDEINQLKKRSAHIGRIGQRIDSVAVETVSSVWSDRWQTHFVTVITEDKNVLFFANRCGADIGEKFTLTGRVKRHADQGQTQLNYVKLVK